MQTNKNCADITLAVWGNCCERKAKKQQHKMLPHDMAQVLQDSVPVSSAILLVLNPSAGAANSSSSTS